MSSPLPVAVIGCGRMGKLHARTYAGMPQVKLVGVYDLNAFAAEAVAAEYKTEPFTDLDELRDKVKAVTIAVPTQQHLTVAEPFLRAGIACLIEKPLARDVAECRRVAEVARQAGTVVQVGHIERFNPAVRALQNLSLEARYLEVDRISPMTFRSIDVGVVLDMMIHDIDIVLKLGGGNVTQVEAVGVSVVGEYEDVCNARLTFANGCVANLTASRLAMKTERRLRVFSRDAYVSLDYQKRHGVVARRSGNVEAIRETVERLRHGEIPDLSQLNYSDLVKVDELRIENVDPLKAQAEAFVRAVVEKTEPVVTVEDGLAAVEIARHIVEAIGPGSRV